MKTKKKHTGLKVFLTILIILILILGGCWLYLSEDYYDVGSRQLSLDEELPYAGKASLTADGLAEIPMDASDAVWLLRQKETLSFGSDAVSVDGAALDIQPEGITADVLAKALGWLPLPVHAEFDVTPRESELNATLRTVKLGRWLRVPENLLSRFDLKNQYTISYRALAEDADICSLRLESGGFTVYTTFPEKLEKADLKSTELADTLMLFGAKPDEILETASAEYRAGDEDSAQAAAARNALLRKLFGNEPEFTRLLALCNPSAVSRFLSGLSPFEQRYLLPVTQQDVDAAAEQYNSQYILPMITDLTALLNALREKYQSLGIKVTDTGFVDAQTGEPITASLLCPQTRFADADCEPVLLCSGDVRRAPMTADMPTFDRIEKEGRSVAQIYDKMNYDIGWILKLPDGPYAFLYYFSTGELCVHTLPADVGEEEFVSLATPQVYDFSYADYPHQRLVHAPAGEGLTDYVVFLPWDVEAAYSEE